MYSLVLLLALGVVPDIPYQKVATPRDAVAYAAVDLLAVPPGDQPYMRYLWMPQASPSKTAGVIYTLNTISRSAIMYRPVVLHEGALIRVDLRRLAPAGKDLEEFMHVWDSLDVENYYFHTVREEHLTRTIPGATRWETVAPYRGRDGRMYTQRQVVDPPRQESSTRRVVEPALHTNPEKALLLRSLTDDADNPIMRADQFVILALTQLNGGAYYDFVGIKKAEGSDLAAYLKNLGADEKLVEDNLRSDERIAMFKSGVTGKPRRLRFWNSPHVRATVGDGLVTISDDIKDGNFNPRQHPVKSLSSEQVDAHEIIVMKANGMQEFFITNGQGELADEVPPDIAVDSTIPNPHTKRLEPALSCIACHGPNDGYIPARNDVQKLLRAFRTEDGYERLNAYADDNLPVSPPELVERLAGWFSGDAERTAFRDARNDHHRAIFSVTRTSAKEAAASVRDMRDDYRYGVITPKVACAELGYKVDNEKDAVALFNVIVPFTPANTLGLRTEDVTVGSLRAYDPIDPIEINRFDWEQIYADVMTRVRTKELEQLNAARKAKE